MTMKTVRRIAAYLLKAGKSRVRIAPGEQKAAEEALTREDIRSLIDRGIVYALPKQGVSRVRGRRHDEQRRLGRRRGHGSRKGTKNARLTGKDSWMMRVRAQRSTLSALHESGAIDHKTYRHTYRMVKGGAFKGRETMKTHIREAGLMKEVKREAKPQTRQNETKK
jgi:large subunit ribosomal protein L19e